MTHVSILSHLTIFDLIESDIKVQIEFDVTIRINKDSYWPHRQGNNKKGFMNSIEFKMTKS